MSKPPGSPGSLHHLERDAIVAVSGLLLITLATALFDTYFNHRSVDLTPWLRPMSYSDTLDKGHSISRAENADGSIRFHYWQKAGFGFPYSGGRLQFDSATPRNLRDFSNFSRLRLRFRHHHPGSPLLRLLVESSRKRGKSELLVANQLQFRSNMVWTEHDMDLGGLQIPSWYIAQHGMEPDEQKVLLDDVRDFLILTPDVVCLSDSGMMEIGSVRLEGPLVSRMRLILALQVVWVGSGILFLLVAVRSWRNRALQESDRATQAEELARTKSDFLATMSHEIRTPLNGVIVPAQLLQSSELTQEQSDHVQTILESGNHLAAILQDALDFSKIEAGKLELEKTPYSLSRAFESVRRIFESKAKEKGIELTLVIDPDLPASIVGDPLRIRQILINLVSNALKFTEHGSIRVEARRVRKFGVASAEARIRILVEDTGIGMDAVAAKRLFQKYTQLESSTSRRFGGTGLGLSIAQGLVEAMGGRIEVESVVGRGSKFFFSIPFQEAPAGDEEESETFPVFDAMGMRVLVVDDNRVNLKVANAMLKKIGCEVESEASGKAALQLLGSRTFDLILMDCHMPELDGFEATRILRGWTDHPDEFRRKASDTPVIALTADVLPDIRQRCLAARMDGVVSKPFRQEQLVREIARWSTGRRVEPDQADSAEL